MGRHEGRPQELSLIGPATDGETIDITSADHTVANQNGAKGLFVGSAGAVKMLTIADTTLTFTGVVAGTVLPIQFSVIFKVGTTASDMVALL